MVLFLNKTEATTLKRSLKLAAKEIDRNPRIDPRTYARLYKRITKMYQKIEKAQKEKK